MYPSRLSSRRTFRKYKWPLHAIASVLLLAYVIVQAVLQPKARLTNIVDLLLSAILLLLIRASMQEKERFAAAWTLISLSLLTLVLAFMTSQLLPPCVTCVCRGVVVIQNLC